MSLHGVIHSNGRIYLTGDEAHFNKALSVKTHNHRFSRFKRLFGSGTFKAIIGGKIHRLSNKSAYKLIKAKSDFHPTYKEFKKNWSREQKISVIQSMVIELEKREPSKEKLLPRDELSQDMQSEACPCQPSDREPIKIEEGFKASISSSQKQEAQQEGLKLWPLEGGFRISRSVSISQGLKFSTIKARTLTPISLVKIRSQGIPLKIQDIKYEPCLGSVKK